MNTEVPEGLDAAVPSCVRVGSSVTIICRDGGSWEPKGNAAVVVAWLALEGHADRRRVSATLWPESDAAQARSNLRVLTHRVNQKFGGELLVGNEHLALDAAQAHIESHDAHSLLAALAAGGAARCELLADAGLDASAGTELQAWLDGARQRLKRVQLACLRQALAQAIAVAEHERAVVLAKACVQIDPLSEQGHRQLMEVFVRAGDRAAALAAYEQCKAALRRHLGVLPDSQTRAVHLRILQEQALGTSPDGSPAPEADGPATLGGVARLPLVEREAVLRQAQAALEQGAHLVVQGEPGVGKTRLLRHLVDWAGDDAEPVAIGSVAKQEPYAAIAQLLLEMQPRRAPRVGVPEQIELARLAPMAFVGVKPSEAPMSAQRLHAALRHWLAQLGDAGVRVLVIDDVQYADAASQAALASLLQWTPEAASRVPALLLGHRSGEIEAVLDQAVTDAQTRLRARRVELPRLTAPGVLALLKAMDRNQRAADPEALAEHLHRRTGGNPLFVIELARQSLEQGQAADVADLQALLGASLEGCSELAQQLAAVAAVAAEDFSVELAAAVSGHNALALMPAWRQLQQRGLFAGHGLAHDLVRDAVMAGLPQAILQELHRQVGQTLEAQGAQGSAVLRHWLAADEADRALPHAVHQLHIAAAAGLPTARHGFEVLGLLERASDRVLMDNLWLTADVDIDLTREFGATAPWPRLRALRQRVERLPEQGNSAVWIAFETARDRWHIDGSVKGAYEALAPLANRLPRLGVERARVEHALSLYYYQLTSEARSHVARAREALVGLPEHMSLAGLRAMIDTAAGVFLDPVEGMRFQAARWHAARRRGDLALAASARALMAYAHSSMGSAARALGHYARMAEAQGIALDALDDSHARYRAAINAMDSGHYTLSQRLFAMNEGPLLERVPLFMALIALRLGDVRQAERHAAGIHPELPQRHSGILFTHAHLRIELEHCHGRDPLPVLHQLLAQMRELGVAGTRLHRFAWEVSLHDQPAVDRLEAGEALLAALRRNGGDGGILSKALLEVAETRVEAGVPGAAALAAEAARFLRRGYGISTMYQPNGLVRCARLLAASQAREADALMHLARRWVRQAMQRLSPETQEGFTRNVAVNRWLLGEDEKALSAQPLR